MLSAFLQIELIVLHEVYSRTDQGEEVEPKYGTSVVTLEDGARSALQDRIVKAIDNEAKCMELDIAKTGSEDMVSICRSLEGIEDSARFVEESKRVADKLTAAQTRKNIPGGVLVVMKGTTRNDRRPYIGIIKAEVHNGFRRTSGEDGSLGVQFLNDLFLTPQTRLYKMGFFLMEETEDGEVEEAEGEESEGIWRAFVYDDHISTTTKAAHYFFDSFLGCRIKRTSARDTRNFYEHTREFIDRIDCPEDEKIEYHNALVTYLKVDQSPTVSSDEFAGRYFEEQHRDEFSEFMRRKDFPETPVMKDLSDLKRKLRHRKLRFPNDITISAPSEEFERLIAVKVVDATDGDMVVEPNAWTEVTIKGRISRQE